jgi:hypothetical protein
MAIGLAGQVDVVGEAAGAGQEALVLAPLDRLADAELLDDLRGVSGGMLSLPSIETPPYSGVSCRRSLWRCGRGMRAGKAGPVAPVFAGKIQAAGTPLDHGGGALFRQRPEAPFAANAADLQQTAERRAGTPNRLACGRRPSRPSPAARRCFPFFSAKHSLTHSIYSFST